MYIYTCTYILTNMYIQPYTYYIYIWHWVWLPQNSHQQPKNKVPLARRRVTISVAPEHAACVRQSGSVRKWVSELHHVCEWVTSCTWVSYIMYVSELHHVQGVAMSLAPHHAVCVSARESERESWYTGCDRACCSMLPVCERGSESVTLYTGDPTQVTHSRPLSPTGHRLTPTFTLYTGCHHV